jgi:hypothetical protein
MVGNLEFTAQHSLQERTLEQALLIFVLMSPLSLPATQRARDLPAISSMIRVCGTKLLVFALHMFPAFQFGHDHLQVSRKTGTTGAMNELGRTACRKRHAALPVLERKALVSLGITNESELLDWAP